MKWSNSFLFRSRVVFLFQVTKELLHFRHKMSPYLGQVLRGRIETTVLRGRAVYTWAQGHIAATPSGVLLLDNPLVLPAGAQ